MIKPDFFLAALQQNGVSFFTGVPDSLLKDFLKYADDHLPASAHIITANEAQAVALAGGYHIASGKVPLVYLQNSGLGNIVNPILTMFNKDVFPVPMLLLIGWRGEPGTSDEPQHMVSGRVTPGLLKTLNIDSCILADNETVASQQIKEAVTITVNTQQPFAILVRKNSFDAYSGEKPFNNFELSREEVLEEFIKQLSGTETIVCTTGKTGREFIEINRRYQDKIKAVFPCVGAMGLANHVALGISLFNKEKTILFDGDGSLLMHMGSLPHAGVYGRDNFIYILINNGAHESVGAQATVGFKINFQQIAGASGFADTVKIETRDQLHHWLTASLLLPGKKFAEVMVNLNSRKGLGRPSESPAQVKNQLQKQLGSI
jgi:phosphonopyruvate decarboxylase